MRRKNTRPTKLCRELRSALAGEPVAASEAQPGAHTTH